MSEYLCISVTFLDPLFHGKGDYDQPEWPPPAHEHVEAPVTHPLEHAVDGTRAADRLELVLGEPHNPELAARADALLDHHAVALLEDVQRNLLAGQRD